MVSDAEPCACSIYFRPWEACATLGCPVIEISGALGATDFYSALSCPAHGTRRLRTRRRPAALPSIRAHDDSPITESGLFQACDCSISDETCCKCSQQREAAGHIPRGCAVTSFRIPGFQRTPRGPLTTVCGPDASFRSTTPMDFVTRPFTPRRRMDLAAPSFWLSPFDTSPRCHPPIKRSPAPAAPTSRHSSNGRLFNYQAAILLNCSFSLFPYSELPLRTLPNSLSPPPPRTTSSFRAALARP